jgi:chemotaxis response regulator CheB
MGQFLQPSHNIVKTKSSLGRRQKKGANVRGKPSAVLSSLALPIIGIGTSAGGLEALEHFLSHVPKSSGMAFVIVQHLDPTRKGLMPELLQRITGMKVNQVKDRTLVQRNSVYVIPPNKDMSILHGVLHLLEPASPRGLRLPIDFFLRSLAQDQQEHSIGVILSGMGSDGTLGLRAIKEKGGWYWFRTQRRPNSMACRAAQLIPVWQISWHPWMICPEG